MRETRLVAQGPQQSAGRNSGKNRSGIDSSVNRSCYSNHLFECFDALNNLEFQKEAYDNL